MNSDDLAIWAHGNATCNNCGYKWIAVWPLGAEDLECLQCGSLDTEREAAHEPQ